MQFPARQRHLHARSIDTSHGKAAALPLTPPDRRDLRMPQPPPPAPAPSAERAAPHRRRPSPMTANRSKPASARPDWRWRSADPSPAQTPGAAGRRHTRRCRSRRVAKQALCPCAMQSSALTIRCCDRAGIPSAATAAADGAKARQLAQLKSQQGIDAAVDARQVGAEVVGPLCTRSCIAAPGAGKRQTDCAASRPAPIVPASGLGEYPAARLSMAAGCDFDRVPTCSQVSTCEPASPRSASPRPAAGADHR